MLFPSIWKWFEADVSEDPSDLFNLKLDVAPTGKPWAALQSRPVKLWILSSVLCNSAVWKVGSLWVGTTAWVGGVAWEGCWCIQKRCWNQPQQVLGELFSFLVCCSFAATLPECCFCHQPAAGRRSSGLPSALEKSHFSFFHFWKFTHMCYLSLLYPMPHDFSIFLYFSPFLSPYFILGIFYWFPFHLSLFIL